MPWCAGWGFQELLGGHFAELARLAHTRAMAAFAAALTPMLATPPARMFAATNMLVCVLLLLVTRGVKSKVMVPTVAVQLWISISIKNEVYFT